MGLEVTLTTMFIAAAIAGWANWRERKPYVPGSPPLISYSLIQFIGLMVFIVMAAHLVTLVTGKPFVGRTSR